MGMLYHPIPSSSLGLVIDRINEPKFDGTRQKRLYRPGAAFRPYGEKITLSADMRWPEGEGASGLNGNFRIETAPLSRLHLAVDYATEGTWRLSFAFDIEQAKVGSQVRLSKSRDFDGGSYFVELSALNYSSSLGSGKTGIISLSNDLVEEPGPPGFFDSGQKPFYKVIAAIRKSADDPAFDHILIKIDGGRYSLAWAQEIRNAILKCREKGKEITVYLNSGGNISYYIASAADKIVMSPSGYLDLRGIYATATFYTGTMEKLGIKAQVVSTGPHKTYGDAFTEKALTNEAKEQLNWLLDDLYAQMVRDIANDRKMTETDVRKMIDRGPYTARDAYSAGLIDKLAYYDDLAENAETGSPAMIDLYDLYNRAYYNPRWSESRTIAIVFADGSIRSGASGKSLWEGKITGSSTLAEALKSVRNDRDIKAVVLRVNSPGGDLFGSDEIYRQMELLKSKKPLVVSMAGVAASGGYYISMAGDNILVSPATITGSIGVVAGKPDMSGFYEKIGLNKQTIRKGEHSDIRSLDRAATDEEYDLVVRQVGQYYDDFINKVSTWRKIESDSVEAIAGGRVWTGRQALERGLVDSYGGIWEAIELARKSAGIDQKDKLVIKVYPRHKFTFFNPPVTSLVESGFKEIVNAGAEGNFSLRLPYDLTIE
jgi:protease-4